MLFLAHLLKMMNINDSMKSSIFISLFVLLCMGTSAQEYDLFLCIGQSNMAGRGYMSEEVLDTRADALNNLLLYMYFSYCYLIEY